MPSACHQTKCSQNCDNCKHALSSSKNVYCGKLREIASLIESCPHFELEPPEYKLYRRM